MSCIHRVCQYFNFKGSEVFEMSAVDFIVYLNYINADLREKDRREREAQARLRAKR